MTGPSRERWQVEVNARLARLELQADEAEIINVGLGARDHGTSTNDNDYLDLHSWVRDYLCPTFSRPLGGEFRWCSEWQEHREAVERLRALWRSWTALRRDPALGMSAWLHQFLDPQLVILMSAHGPFARCSMQRHEP